MKDKIAKLGFVNADENWAILREVLNEILNKLEPKQEKKPKKK